MLACGRQQLSTAGIPQGAEYIGPRLPALSRSICFISATTIEITENRQQKCRAQRLKALSLVTFFRPVKKATRLPAGTGDLALEKRGSGVLQGWKSNGDNGTGATHFTNNAARQHIADPGGASFHHPLIHLNPSL